jgi:hypothetical protein
VVGCQIRKLVELLVAVTHLVAVDVGFDVPRIPNLHLVIIVVVLLDADE